MGVKADRFADSTGELAGLADANYAGAVQPAAG
jgi:hypothetical protein